MNKTLAFALLTIWLCGAGFSTYYIARIASEFRESAEMTQNLPIQPAATYTLKLDNRMVFSKADSLQYNLNFKNADAGFVIEEDAYGDFNSPRNVAIHFEPATGDPYLEKRYRSQGRSFKDALQNARDIQYNFVADANTFMFSPRILLKQSSLWRDQNVRLTFHIPVGTKFSIQRELLQYVNVYSWDCGSEAPYAMWEMTTEGLKCIEEHRDDHE